MATVPHVISGMGIRKFQADGFLLTRVYNTSQNLRTPSFSLFPSVFLSHLLSTIYWASTREDTGWDFKIISDSNDFCHISTNLHCRIFPYHLFKRNIMKIQKNILWGKVNSLPYPNLLIWYDHNFSRIREWSMSPNVVLIGLVLTLNFVQSAWINGSKPVFRYSWTKGSMNSCIGGELAYRHPALQGT